MNATLLFACAFMTLVAATSTSGAEEPAIITHATLRTAGAPLFVAGHAPPASNSTDLEGVANAVLARHAPRLASYAHGPVVVVPFASKYTIGGALAIRWP